MERVRDAGVAVEEDGRILPSAGLRTPGAALLALRTAPGRPAFDVVSDAGALSGQLPAFAALRDTHYRLRRRGCIPMIGAISIADCLVLRGWNLPAVPAVGLETVAVPAANTFASALGIAWHASTSPERERPHTAPVRLLLAAWQPAQWRAAPPERLPFLIDHLRNLSQHSGLDVSQIALWAPGHRLLESIVFCRGHNAADDSHRHLMESLLRDRRPAVPPPTTPLTLDASFRVFLERRHLDGELGLQARRNFKSAVQRKIDALLAAADEQPDPRQANLLIAEALLFRHVHIGLAAVSGLTASDRDLLLRQVLSAVDRVLRIQRTVPGAAPSLGGGRFWNLLS